MFVVRLLLVAALVLVLFYIISLVPSNSGCVDLGPYGGGTTCNQAFDFFNDFSEAAASDSFLGIVNIILYVVLFISFVVFAGSFAAYVFWTSDEPRPEGMVKALWSSLMTMVLAFGAVFLVQWVGGWMGNMW